MGVKPDPPEHRCARGQVVAAHVRCRPVQEGMATRFVGARVKRVEDPRLLTGRGLYVDDITVPGMLHASFARSPHAHARVVRVDAASARRVPGVVAVFTGHDIARMTNAFVGLLPLPGLYHPMHPALAVDRVRLVGDPLALVVATTRAIAEDAAELVAVEYELLPPVATIDQALDPRRPPVWPGADGNVLFRSSDEYGDVDDAFRAADHIVRQRFVQHRHANQPMETRGCVAEVDALSGSLTYYAGTQSPHVLKWSLALLADRQSFARSLQEIWRQRDRLRELARAAAAYATRGGNVPPRHRRSRHRRS